MTHAIFYGEADGDFGPLLAACREDCPQGVALLGCLTLSRSVHAELADLFAAGVNVQWLPGRLPSQAAPSDVNLWKDHPEGNLHLRIAVVSGMLVAGLGGVFKQDV